MQNIKQKKIIFLFLFLSVGIKQSNSQIVSNNIRKADSLYNSQKYTESLKIYENELAKEHTISPKTMLKMARINEGAGKKAEALYYLSLYYKNIKDETVIPKTITIAKNNNYQGWEYDDFNFIQNMFHKNKKTIVVVLFLLLTTLFIVFIYRKLNHKSIPVLMISLFFIGISIFSIIEFSTEKIFGIILNNNALIMEKPTAGAKLIKTSTQGHKVEVLTQNDIWTKIKWENKTAYIRTNNLIVIK